MDTNTQGLTITLKDIDPNVLPILALELGRKSLIPKIVSKTMSIDLEDWERAIADGSGVNAFIGDGVQVGRGVMEGDVINITYTVTEMIDNPQTIEEFFCEDIRLNYLQTRIAKALSAALFEGRNKIIKDLQDVRDADILAMLERADSKVKVGSMLE